MSCKNCKSDRILLISAKCSDLFDMHYKGKDYEGYVPTNLHIGDEGYGDYVQLEICMQCGMIQGDFPVSENKLAPYFVESKKNEEDGDEDQE